MALSVSALDAWSLTYAGVASVLIVARWPAGQGSPAPLVFAHALLAGAALLAPAARRSSSVGRFLADFYPLLLVPALYTAVGLLNAAVGVSHDLRLQAWEAAVFGGQPSHDWIRAWPSIWLSWLLHLGYLSYYAIVAGAPLGLLWSGRPAAARRTGQLVSVTFYLCYSIFLVFPVAGPRYLFPQAVNPATEALPAAFTQRLLDTGAAWGTAFPSSHVAASWVAAVCAWRGWRPLGLALVPAAGLLTLGTVYGQFHYAIDALAGAALAAAVLAADEWRARRFSLSRPP